MEGKENKETLLNRVLGRIKNKEHSPKMWKRLAGLVLAGAIGLTFTACDTSTAVDNSTKDNSSRYEDSSNIDSSNSDSSSVEEPPVIDIDYSKFSPIIQAMFNNDYYVNLTKKIQQNVANEDYADYYSHPTKFWDSVGVDADKIRTGEIKCKTDAYVLDEEPNNLYVATYITDPTNTYYDQYIIRYTLTDQEMKEYDTLRMLRVWQNFYMNDILSQYKTAEIVRHGKIAIETYNFIKEFLQNNLYLTGFQDMILQFEKDIDGRAEVSIVGIPEKPYPAYKPNENEWGLPSKHKVGYYKSIIFNQDVKYSINNNVFYLDKSTIEDENQDFFELEDLKDKSSTTYCRQDLCSKLFPNMYSELKEEHLAEFLEKVNEKNENK